MKYRLLALDLDGTLLNSKKQITQKTKDAIAAAQKQGVHVVLSTGRIVGEAAEFAREICCEDLMVTAGGAAIATASNEKILYDWSMPCEIGAAAVEAVQHLPVRIMIYIGDKIYINSFSDRDFIVNYRVEGFHANKIVMEDIAGYIRAHNLQVTKVYALGEQADLEKAMQSIRLLPDITITSSGSDNFEIMPIGVDKGMALIKLGQMLHITPEEMIGVGDSDNDAAMLRAVGLPVAMGNADDSVKQIVKYVTNDCDHDGIAEVIQRFILEA